MSKKLTTDEFILKAEEIHKGTYIYTDCEYINAKSKCIITCSIHGNFSQKATHHLSGHGCPKCWKKSLASFIARAKNIHGNTFDYSLVDYVNTSTKIKIKCSIHGVFEQRPNDHVKGQGCPVCANKNKGGWTSYRYKGKATILYYVQFSNNAFKIGLTRSSVKERFRKESAIYSILREWKFADGEDAFNIEQEILNQTSASMIDESILVHGGNSEIRNYDFIDVIITTLSEKT